jgi:hypothetical protein
MQTRTFETRGPVNPVHNYVVPRTEEIADLVQRIEKGRYIVIFAPRQTGKTTFFRWALDSLDETFGQPFLVNRMAQILTSEMEIPLDEIISSTHFERAHKKILNEQNVHFSHLTTNIRRKPRFETLLMEICSYEAGISFNLRNEYISELVTYGVLKEGKDGFCEIAHPIYQYCIVQAFNNKINGVDSANGKN